jgi:hypothetical protein
MVANQVAAAMQRAPRAGGPKEGFRPKQVRREQDCPATSRRTLHARFFGFEHSPQQKDYSASERAGSCTHDFMHWPPSLAQATAGTQARPG